jgi:hypothetical protein
MTSLNRWAFIADDPTAWCSLSETDRQTIGERLRDRFFELSALPAAKREDRVFRSIVEAIDPVPSLRVEGFCVSFHPTARFQSLRFVDANRLEPERRALFARPSPEMPMLAAVFVDPEEFSFRTFENIIPLDRAFEDVPLTAQFKNRQLLAPRCFSFEYKVSEETRQALDRLDEFGLYVPPLNSSTRGGLRCIFHSAHLAKSLTGALHAALPAQVRKGFAHVNPIFRLNRFEPGDKPFRSHVDTPYFDAARKHTSRFTLLIYLSGGRASPALRIGEKVKIDELAPYTAILFDQALEHEGAPFADGRKVFLRTELIFEDDSVTEDPAIGEVFAKATYFTGESVFAPDLARWADACYNRAAEAHFKGLGPAPAEEVFVHKEFRGVHYVANGYDFWFSTRACSLEECAALALMDTLNVQIGGTAFKKRCRTEVLNGKPAAFSWIPKFLAAQPAPGGEPIFAELDKASLFPPSEACVFCCPWHCGGPNFQAERCDGIVGLYERAQQFACKRVNPAPLVILGEEVFLDRSRFVRRPGAIHVLSDHALAPVNFASCWGDGAGMRANYLDVEAKLSTLLPLVPPILFTEIGGCYHLRFDFFRNTWMVSNRQCVVPVPRIINVDIDVDEAEWGTPWIDAIDRASLTPEDHAILPEIGERDEQREEELDEEDEE